MACCFRKIQKKIDSDTIVVGHSLGVAFLLTVLEETAVRTAFFVASVSGPLNNEFDPIMTTFSHKKFNYEKIRKNCKNFYVFHSDNDPYIPLQDAEKLAKNLGVKLILIHGAGHFNSKAGYTKFGLLLEKIKSQL